LVLNTLLMKDTQGEMDSIFRKWGAIVDRINVIPVGRYGNLDELSDIDKNSLQPERRVCHQPFDRLLVFWDGSVTVCCADINGELCVGDIQHDRLEYIWQNSKMHRIRNLLKKKIYAEIPICRRV